MVGVLWTEVKAVRRGLRWMPLLPPRAMVMSRPGAAASAHVWVRSPIAIVVHVAVHGF